MINIDLHVHTSFGSPCAELHDPETLPSNMGKNLMHGIVITEHNVMWPLERIKRINSLLSPGRRIYSGIEVSTSCCHVVVIGLNKLDGIYPGMETRKLVDMAKKLMAVTILVHPFQNSCFFSSPNELINDFDCVEIASTTTSGEMRRKTVELCLGSGSIPVAGSDAHCSDNLGMAFTSFPSLPEDEKELAAMIRQGLGIPKVKDVDGERPVLC